MPTLPDQSDWNFELLDQAYKLIEPIAKELGLETYPNQIEVITAEQMLDAYSTVALPVFYNHWSFGKNFIRDQKNYQKGDMGLAFEVVINSNPCIAYLMENNTFMMQILVLSHACFGHNSFFKNNYLFKEWTDAEGIIDYLMFAKNYIQQCEQKYGADQVEEILDAAHALQVLGVDRYKRPNKLSVAKEKAKQHEREEYLQSQVNDLWRTIPTKATAEDSSVVLEHPEENLLYFIEKNAPLLKPWEREVIRIVRKVSQYFYPQRQTQVSNEGKATFCHYNIMNKLYDYNHISEGMMLEFLQSHTSVVRQQPGARINPYALGFAIYQDIRRMCANPTPEDKEWFPELCGKDWMEETRNAAYNFRDESFISQFLSPKVIRDMRLFSVLDDSNNTFTEVSSIHNDSGYTEIRNKLSEQYNLSMIDPQIQVTGFDKAGDRSLQIKHIPYKGRSLNEHWPNVLYCIRRLWGFDVQLETIADGAKAQYTITKASK